MLFEGKWAFEDKDVEELIDALEVDAGNADVAHTFECGVNEGDAAIMFIFCRSQVSL